MKIEELRRYEENSYYSPSEVAEKLIQLSNLINNKEDYKSSEMLKDDLENALYQLQAIAQDEYNNDYYRTLYNVLLVITNFEQF